MTLVVHALQAAAESEVLFGMSGRRRQVLLLPRSTVLEMW